MRMFREGLIGMSIGCFIEILGIALDDKVNIIHPTLAGIYLLVTFITGLLSELFLIESINYYIEIGIHFLITFTMFYIYNALTNHTSFFELNFLINYSIIFITTYAFAWLIVFIFLKRDTDKINDALIKRNKK
ncbi:DUF3021 family protein [Apilactobacillus xinyiensis]|uniref:DUF3021 family protein n=1 Tax=Apilactobacillus xinyiensis TaxID=2841032 RepID=UPI001C7D6880|nr:DUF3021 family protein [Apilactobacillus xinyiensis]